MSDISSIRIDNTIYNIKDNNATRKDETYTTTEINTLLSAKANIVDVYSKAEVDTILTAKANTVDVYNKTEADTLLAAKANITDLGDLATEDDAPSDNNQYARKNGTWEQIQASGTSIWGNITGTLSDQTDLANALNTKANTADIYSKTEADTLLANKANTADLGGMAAEDDTPSDDSEYVRKNGAWSVPSYIASRYTQTVTLNGKYTSESKMYTLESNGLLGVRLSGNKTGAARICDSQNNEPYLQLGLASGGYITWLPKGMRVYIYGSVDAAYFMPLE